jgi:hypothetical protein
MDFQVFEILYGHLAVFSMNFLFSNVLADVSDVFRKRVEIKALPMFEVLYGRPFWLCLFIFLMFYDCFQCACLFFYVLNVSHVFAKFSDVFWA